MEVGTAALEDGDDLAGTSERQPKRSGVWNKFDDAAAAGILAAARAAGATGAGIKYGEVNYKVWFNKPQGDEPDEVSEKIKALQIATADARLAELERRSASQSTRAQKEKQRKARQKAAKKAAQTIRPETTSVQGTPSRVQSQQPMRRDARGQQQAQAERMTASDRAASTNAASITAASMEQPATLRVQRKARLGGKAWQFIALNGTRAATMNEQQLGQALSGAHDEQQRTTLLHQMMQREGPPPKGMAAVSPAGHMPMDTQPPQAEDDMGFALHE